MRSLFWLLLGQQKPWLALVVLALTIPGEAALAQLIPDTTLGTQSSTISTSGSVDIVNGGLRAGSNLFHSFREFNVGTGRSLYFTDPGVTNILTRVTGNNPSTINGRLGVNGLANLFLINPNGIIFGAGASLDIRGSFTATTASAIKFADGSEFSATNPAASNLLTISVPIGLQRGGTQPPATIGNRGRLQAGQDLTLDANFLDLQGQLQAGRDLNLLATGTVQVRDTVSEPFLAKSGGDLTIRGDRGIDILALNHFNQAAFQSGGNLTLISDGVISGDAQFESGGSFQIQPITQELATFTSLYDPIVTSAGDVNLAFNYTGASLLIEAGGNIRIQGTVNITTPDAAAPFVGDDSVLNSQSGLILRSGQTTRRYSSNSGPVPGSSTGVGLVPPAGITLNRGVMVAPGGVVRLTAGGLGDLRTQQITAPKGEITMISGRSLTTNGQPLNVATNTGNAGRIRLTTLNGNLTTGDLIANGDASTTSGDIGNGGTIDLSSTNGNITTGQLQTGAYSFANSGNSGNVTFFATNGSITTGNINNSLFGYDNIGNGGSIMLATTNGLITTGDIDNTTSLAGLGTSGNGGTVTITGSNGTITTGMIDAGLRATSTDVTRPPAITITNTNGAIVTADLYASSNNYYDIGANGGTITLTSNWGNITTGDLNVGSFGGLGGRQGGVISVTALDGNINTARLSADAGGFLQNPLGNGGTIVLASPKGNITTTDVSASSTTSTYYPSDTTGSAGRIAMTAAGSILTGSLSSLALAYVSDPAGLGLDIPPQNYNFTLVGNGGTIALTSTGGSIQTGDLYSFSTAALDQGFYLGLPEYFDDFNRALRTTASVGGDIRLNAAQNIMTGLISTIGNTGSGAITLKAGNAFTGMGTIISSDTFGTGHAGNISVTARSITLADGGQLSASAHSSGNGGNIAIAADTLNISGITTQPPQTDLLIQTPTGLTVLPNVYLGGYVPTGDLANLAPGGAYPSGIFAQTTQGSTGSAGNINIQTQQLILRNQGTIGTTTFGSGSAGNITIRANSVLADNGSIFSGVASGATGNSGTIALSAQSLDLINRGRIQALTLGPGRAGDIQIQAGTTTISDYFSGIISGSGTPDQRGGKVGDGGNIRIASDTLQIKNSAIVSGSTFTQGQSGRIEVTAKTVELLNQGGLSATTQNQGNAGSITVNASDRVLISGERSGIFASTTKQSTGNGGGVFLTSGQVVLQDRGRITTGSDGNGQSGDIQISANQIDLDTHATITAETGGRGKGGNISLTTNQLTVQDAASVSVSTEASGNAGNLTVAARDRTLISGNDSGLFASTTAQSSGMGGSISLTTANLSITDNGRISTSSQGSGRGGDVQVSADQITLNNRGKIFAETAASDGGNINLNVRDILLLRRNSLISASAGTTQAGGNGGNVGIKAGFVVGVLSENSDIRANAFTGNGGQVNITAQGIYGLKYQSQDTPNSDITASSLYGVSGTVTLNTLNVDPNRGLIQLPSNFSDSASQIAQTCSPQQQGNSFVVTGRGGVSPDPTESLNQTRIWQEQAVGKGQQAESRGQNSKSKIQNAIVEATAWQRNSDGSISLVAESGTSEPAIATYTCQPQIHSEVR